MYKKSKELIQSAARLLFFLKFSPYLFFFLKQKDLINSAAVPCAIYHLVLFLLVYFNNSGDMPPVFLSKHTALPPPISRLQTKFDTQFIRQFIINLRCSSRARLRKASRNSSSRGFRQKRGHI